MLTRLITIILCLLLFGVGLSYGDTTLVLTNPALQGQRGTTVGWDFTLTNGSATYDLYINSIYIYDTFSSLYTADGVIGTFAVSAFNYTDVVVKPGDTYYSTITGIPLATFAIDPTAPDGIVSGPIALDYSLFDSGFTYQGGGNLVAQFGGIDAVASVEVVPEPTTYVLLAVSLGVVGLARKKMQKLA
jgi:PEP-CTERM motif